MLVVRISIFIVNAIVVSIKFTMTFRISVNLRKSFESHKEEFFGINFHHGKKSLKLAQCNRCKKYIQRPPIYRKLQRKTKENMSNYLFYLYKSVNLTSLKVYLSSEFLKDSFGTRIWYSKFRPRNEPRWSF